MQTEALENPSEAKIVPGWSEYTSILAERFYRGTSAILRGRPAGYIQIGGPDNLDVGASGVEDEDDETPRPVSPSSAVHLEVRNETTKSLPDSQPYHPASTQSLLFLLEIVRRHAEFTSSGVEDLISEQLELSTTISITPTRLAALGLNPFSSADGTYLQDLVWSNIKGRGETEGVKVEVKTSLLECLGWFVGWS